MQLAKFKPYLTTGYGMHSFSLVFVAWDDVPRQLWLKKLQHTNAKPAKVLTDMEDHPGILDLNQLTCPLSLCCKSCAT